MFVLIFWIFCVYVSLFWKVPYSFKGAQFFPRSSYDPKSSSMKKYEVSAFKRTVERPSSHPRSKVIPFWSSKLGVLFSFPQAHHIWGCSKQQLMRSNHDFRSGKSFSRKSVKKKLQQSNLLTNPYQNEKFDSFLTKD